MKKITKIAETASSKVKLKKIRVAAYCRVSTDSDAQLESLEAQKTHYENYITSRDDWEFAGLYYDEGITGTKKDKRPELLRLIEDCKSGKVNFIITKSISRFSRNTTDCLELVRKLLALRIPIYFEKENIDTGSMESELFLAILSSMAEGESVSISTNSKWSIQKRFENGTYKVSYPPYGYDWDGEQMVINAEQAAVVKEIFAALLSGKGTHAMQVQAELVRRRTVHVSPTGKKRSFSCNHCFAQMVLCGDCGELYRRVHWNNHGCKSIVWRCISRLEPISAEKSCTNRTVNELLLQEITVKAINQILTERDLFLKTLQQNIAKAVVGADTLSPDGIQARLEELQKELIKKANNKQDYDAIADEIFRLRDQKEKSELDSHHREEAMKRIKELQNFIARQETDITEFDETLVKKLIEKITVFADHFTVEFKSGITIDIEA